ncbi:MULTISPECIES: RNA polymerase sigma factor [unclassified Rathayibacter]|uniref:RNA polymerase sigma factor n=1 Tax=unclassified Rathayibacter TaxID=2609250 RepID=UPI00188DAAE0|nr:MULTISPECIES: sigma-70 family RNA polymerase sigma factor [unclassified Rathayibacter]MBF4461754.1 sigma-70 family RNA polymerase sigma factor [Rathayibacter sp. VKM Ac-2879]MBF4503166.1 sigma-70 family RNA polymerase sigma factor [Rathayibacter sp. VKM Ac-2878]
MANHTEADLAKRLASGDSAALAIFFRMHVKAVHRASFAYLANPNHVEDVVQDVFLALWEQRTRMNIVGESVLPWLLVTAKNISSTTNRRERRRTHLALEEENVPVLPPVERDRFIDIDRAIEKLGPTDKAIWRACVTLDLSYDEAASRLGFTHGTARNRLSRMRVLIRKNTSEEGPR